MACAHDFGIMDVFDKEKEYIDYEPQKYHCISIEDDIINSLIEQLYSMKSYFSCFSRPQKGLNHWGITIIPPESLEVFCNVLVASGYFTASKELNELKSLLLRAKKENQYVIHFGI
jgi:hypothetical protein